MQTPCPHCGKMINPAALLASRAAGKPKRFTAKERARRVDRVNKARRLRWQAKEGAQ